ncbi:MAG: ABC transporter substrate-binding protein [Bifidobacterium sp.]|nr:ABC transporter substrate-binding protein [Bifidobacterium sp.]
MIRHTIARALAGALALAIAPLSLGGCGAADAEPHVYFLNSKAEVVEQFNELASMYTKKTGVKVDVLTATSGDYNTTLRSELGKTHAPTMISITGYDTFGAFSDYLEPIQDTDAYAKLTEEGKQNSYRIGSNAYTLPYAAERYGIIANRAILERYCAKDYAVIDSPEDIKDYDTLKRVTESIDEHRKDLGIDAAFATPGLDSSDTYRFTAHMARIPLFYEYRDRNTTFSPTITGTYLKNYKDLLDLELAHSATKASMTPTKNYEQVTNEFAQGKAVFYPNGDWAYAQIKGNAVKDKDLMMLPYYMGIPGEDSYGPAGIYDASWAVNSHASAKDRKATLDFIDWLITDKQAKRILSKDMGFSVPCTTFGSDDQPDNPLSVQARAYTQRHVSEVRSFTIPDQQWQDDLSGALTQYVQGTGSWDQVKDAYVNGWNTEWAANKDILRTMPQADRFA